VALRAWVEAHTRNQAGTRNLLSHSQAQHRLQKYRQVFPGFLMRSSRPYLLWPSTGIYPFGYMIGYICLNLVCYLVMRTGTRDADGTQKASQKFQTSALGANFL